MYANVIVGVDGLSGGRDAAALAASLAAEDAHIALVHVCVTNPVPSHTHSPSFDLADDERARELFASERSLCPPSAEVVRVAAPSVGSGLDQVAEGRGADLIVVGSCHRRGLGRMIAGDDARSALHRARCAVVLAPTGYARGPAPIKVVGLAYDGSPESEVALAHAGLLAADLGAKLTAYNVVELRVYAGYGTAVAFAEDPRVQIAAAHERLGDLGGVDLDVVVAPIREELAAFTAGVDLFVCGSRHSGPVRRVVLGSTSNYLARHSACPLLVTPTTDDSRVSRWRERQGAALA